MNFFEKQERARKQTTLLIVLFAAALLSLILISAVVIAAIGSVISIGIPLVSAGQVGVATEFNWRLIGSIAVTTLLVVGLASLSRLWQLSRGGRVIADQLGGRLINVNCRSNQESRLLNVVEEMAIASGITVPSVYIIDEPGINAFAAGYQTKDAVIGVTQGAIDQLTRAELQGIIAHEFSHILNGDMRLNLRLIGIIFGITFISDLGRKLLGSYHRPLSSTGVPRSTTTRLSGKSSGALLGSGIVIFALGYLGIFFANLIKAAISRQREYLADASAVQFTRNNQGIANALKKIGGSAHYWISKHDSNDVSHMLFTQGVQFKFFRSWMATHPPIEERIKRVEPKWDGNFIVMPLNHQHSTDNSSKQPYQRDTKLTSSFSAERTLLLIEHSGEVSTEAIETAETALHNVRPEFTLLSEEIHDPYSASIFILCLLLDRKNKKIYKLQLESISQYQLVGTTQHVHRLSKMVETIDSTQLMMLIDMTLPILKQLSINQYKSFKLQMQRLITIDNKVSLREWALYYWIKYYWSPGKTLLQNSRSLEECSPFAAQLISALVHVSYPENKKGKAVFNRVIGDSLSFKLQWYSTEELSIIVLTKALNELINLKALQKPVLLKACVNVAQHDDIINAEEMLIIRCIAQALDCPLPVFGCKQLNHNKHYLYTE